MASIQSSLLEVLLQIANVKNNFKKESKNPKRSNKTIFSDPILKDILYERKMIGNREVVTLGTGNKHDGTHIVYFHGGGYVMEADPVYHRNWILKLYKEAGLRITYVDYPLHPEFPFHEILDVSYRAYQHLTDTYPNDSFILMGDSAGGGLALSLACWIRDHQFEPQPSKMVLYSPWVDLNMVKPGVDELAKKDKITDPATLQGLGEEIRAATDLDNAYLSPLHGDLAKLGDMALFYGTKEVFSIDLRDLARKYQSVGNNCRIFEYRNMQHIWHLMSFLPESKKAFRETLDFINN